MDNVTLLSFASASHYAVQQRLHYTAQKVGIKSKYFRAWQLYLSTFYWHNRKILASPKGAGYWLWKPYIILETLKRSSPDEILIYLDTDHVIVQPLDPIIKLCNTQNPIVLFSSHGNRNILARQRTKRDCFILMDCDSQEYYDNEQAAATLIVIRKTRESILFLEQWLENCKDERMITDQPNALGLPNLDGFIEHRHDQAILSLLAYKRKLPIYRFPSERGNHLKMPEYRVIGEKLPEPYSNNPWENSPYGTLLSVEAETIHLRRYVLWQRIRRVIKWIVAVR
ncbi:MAG: hypothetical protein NTV01_20140 [Bacteroidia bacterium]|nr:hypothetical protein [Bacteroidia bacterium]